MANSITSLAQLENYFADLVVTLLGMEADHVLIAYAEMGQNFSTPGQDYCFVWAKELTDDVQMYKNRKEGPVPNNKWKIAQTSMRKVQIMFSFYGEHSDVNALSLKEALYFPDTNISLDQNNLALIPVDVDLTTVKEQINEVYWTRSDLTVNFYNSVTFEQTVNTINSLDLTISTK